MAIIINSSPFSSTTVYNENWFDVFSLNATSNANFKYVFDVYLNTSASTRIARYRIPPNPVIAHGVFNPNRTLEKYLSYDIALPLVGITAATTNSIQSYVVMIGEEYGLSATTTFPNLAGYTGYTINATLDYVDLPYWSTTQKNYAPLTGTTSKFLTTKPTTSWIGANDHETLSFFNTKKSFQPNFVQLDVIHSDTSINTYYIANNTTALTSVGSNITTQ